MKKIFFVLVTSIGILAAVYAQPGNPATNRQTIKKDITRWLQPGTYIPAVQGEVNTRMRFAALKAKMEDAQRDNVKWFRDSAKYVAAGDSALYFTKIGITQQEYHEYKWLSELPLHYAKTDTLRIFKKGQFISFSGSGKLAGLNALRIDLDHNTVQYQDYTLHYVARETGKEAGYTTAAPKRSYYIYRYLEKNDTTEITAENLASMFTIKHVWLHIGQQEGSKKTVLNFSDFQMAEIELKAFISLDVIFDDRIK
jgi:hypothetical protein